MTMAGKFKAYNFTPAQRASAVAILDMCARSNLDEDAAARILGADSNAVTLAQVASYEHAARDGEYDFAAAAKAVAAGWPADQREWDAGVLSVFIATRVEQRAAGN